MPPPSLQAEETAEVRGEKKKKFFFFDDDERAVASAFFIFCDGQESCARIFRRSTGTMTASWAAPETVPARKTEE